MALRTASFKALSMFVAKSAFALSHAARISTFRCRRSSSIKALANASVVLYFDSIKQFRMNSTFSACFGSTPCLGSTVTNFVGSMPQPSHCYFPIARKYVLTYLVRCGRVGGMLQRRCVCGKRLPKDKTRPHKFCSPACRKEAHLKRKYGGGK